MLFLESCHTAYSYKNIYIEFMGIEVIKMRAKRLVVGEIILVMVLSGMSIMSWGVMQ